jgi:hypothetical protein
LSFSRNGVLIRINRLPATVNGTKATSQRVLWWQQTTYASRGKDERALSLLPLHRDWVLPSILCGEVALCRDARDGAVWLCRMGEEAEGWVKIQPATAREVEAFRWTQKLLGKQPQPWPAGVEPE